MRFPENHTNYLTYTLIKLFQKKIETVGKWHCVDIHLAKAVVVIFTLRFQWVTVQWFKQFITMK